MINIIFSVILLCAFMELSIDICADTCIWTDYILVDVIRRVILTSLCYILFCYITCRIIDIRLTFNVVDIFKYLSVPMIIIADILWFVIMKTVFVNIQHIYIMREENDDMEPCFAWAAFVLICNAVLFIGSIVLAVLSGLYGFNKLLSLF